MRNLLLLLSFLFLFDTVRSQTDSVLIQFSGVVLSADGSFSPVSFASVNDMNLGGGTVCDFKGFFSMVIYNGDEIAFTCLGFQPTTYKVKYDGHNPFITDTIYMKPMTMKLPEATVYPWGTRDQFAEAFVHMNIPDDDLARAQKNLDADYLRMIGQDMVFGDVNAHQVLTNYAASYYFKGQYRPVQLLNPMAWAQFFKVLDSGGFKNPNK